MVIKCDDIRYPNRPQEAHRKKYGAELMKRVKIGQKYKLAPFVYYSIINSLQKLIKVPGFLSMCEEWRNKDVPARWLTDGQLWKDWMKPNGVPFLEVLGKPCLHAKH